MRQNDSRIPIIVVMILALLAAGFMRNKTLDYQTNADLTPAQIASRNQGAEESNRRQAQSVLGSMDSYALALVLGGLRGPLVMVLWSTSENQKTEKNLEDFDTKVEWIRLLQPEFDSAMIFQIWNKAYNISVQMASLPNRYATILDALDFAHKVDQSRPDNLNILHMIAQVYSNKLGTIAQEKTYYRRRIREDSLPRKLVGPRLGQANFQRRRMDPLLDNEFRILPEYLVARYPRPAGLPADSDWSTGEELQYLKKYEPYPYGVSTFALAYNYARRADVLMIVNKQQPIQLSESVIDSRPALELRSWGEDEWERGRAAELQLFDLPIVREREKMEEPTAGKATLEINDKNRPHLDAALFAYRLSARLAQDARAEYDRHLANPAFIDKLSMYRSHYDRLDLQILMVTADRLYLEALATSSAEDRAKLLAEAKGQYQKAIAQAELTMLKYYVPESISSRTYGGVAKEKIQMLAPERIHEIMEATRKVAATMPPDSYNEDRPEFEGYIARATARLALIK